MTDYYLKCDTPEFFSDLCDEIRLFFPVKKIWDTSSIPNSGICIETGLKQSGDSCAASAVLYRDGVAESGAEGEEKCAGDGPLMRKKIRKYILKHTLYRALKEYTGVRPPWGSLTGIRPTKLTRDLTGLVDDPYSYITERYDVSGEKAEIARRINRVQRHVIDEVGEDDIDIYIGIPFCRTRCTYCSFISREYSRNTDLKDRFLKELFHEIRSLRSVYEKKNIRCLYIGGGTPTALSDSEFNSLLDTVAECFPVIGEYTVEAGRPDTINAYNLSCMRDHGVGRISVNPQTTNDDTLRLIGRPYENSLFLSAFDAAVSAGFSEVNCDVILGLPGEDFPVMKRTLDDVASLCPSNVTVHTLAVKNSSYLRDDEYASECPEDIGRACEYACGMLTSSGYDPYYLYRQKYMAGNLENTGYCRSGSICRYNVDNMEETVSVLAFGAGAISKRIFPSENRIERACNVKDLPNYCERTEDMIERKRRLFEPSSD